MFEILFQPEFLKILNLFYFKLFFYVFQSFYAQV
jgi:hypothetical protein